ncbi:MAG: VTT domain-containing protein [Pirellulales bacterium]
MRDLVRPALIICLVLALPIVPFLFFGDQAERWVEDWEHRAYSTVLTFWLVVGVLALDIFLPTPSSMISTFGGSHLGIILGTLASWAGMTAGAAIGFWLARRCGQPLAAWLTNQRHLDRMQALSEKLGPLVLVFARGVPVFAEASVLLMGIHGLSWRRFLVPVVSSNLGIALAYSAFGDFAKKTDTLPLALGVAIVLPVILTIVVLKWMPKNT